MIYIVILCSRGDKDDVDNDHHDLDEEEGDGECQGLNNRKERATL